MTVIIAVHGDQGLMPLTKNQLVAIAAAMKGSDFPKGSGDIGRGGGHDFHAEPSAIEKLNPMTWDPITGVDAAVFTKAQTGWIRAPFDLVCEPIVPWIEARGQRDQEHEDEQCGSGWR